MANRPLLFMLEISRVYDGAYGFQACGTTAVDDFQTTTVNWDCEMWLHAISTGKPEDPQPKAISI